MDTTISQGALDALRTAEFRLSLRGYDVDEVDDFLERAAVEADGLREQLRQLTAQLASATDRSKTADAVREPQPVAASPADAAPTPAQSVDSVTKMLEMGERLLAEMRKEAEEEAAALLADAQDRAKQMATDAQQRLADEVARLEGLRQRLGEDVERLSQRIESERTRLSGSLHDLLGWLEQHLQPAAVLETARTGGNGGNGGNGEPATHRLGNGGETEGGAQVLLLDDARGDTTDTE